MFLLVRVAFLPSKLSNIEVRFGIMGENVTFCSCALPEKPAILILSLLLQTHTRLLYSLRLTRFLLYSRSSTKNVWNAKNAI